MRAGKKCIEFAREDGGMDDESVALRVFEEGVGEEIKNTAWWKSSQQAGSEIPKENLGRIDKEMSICLPTAPGG